MRAESWSLATGSPFQTETSDETSTQLAQVHAIAMDLAYDHIVEQSLPKEDGSSRNNGESSDRKPESTLNDDLQEAYRAFSSSSWGSWLGGTVEKVVKQVCSKMRP